MAQGSAPDRERPASVAIHPAAGRTLRFGPFRFDRVNRVLSRDGAEVALPPRALGVLEHLVERPGTIVAKADLIDAVWPDVVVSDTSLTEAVSLVRQALADDPQQPSYVQTVHRRGYRFVAPVEVGPGEAAVAPAIERVEAGAAAPAPASGSPRPVPSSVPWSVAALAVLAAVGAWWLRPAHRTQRLSFAVSLPDAEPLAMKGPPVLALSPGGRVLAYTSGRGAQSQLYLRRLDQLEPAVVPGTAGAGSPFFSPDGRWVGFVADGWLKKVPIDGGTPVSLCELTYPFGASWGEDGTILFTPHFRSGLMRVSAAGGPPQPLTRPDPAAGEIGHFWPEVLPGGRAAVFTVWNSAGAAGARLAVVDLRSGARRALAETGSGARYAATGHLVFTRQGRLLAAPFDAGAARLLGPPAPVSEQVAVSPLVGLPHVALSREGTMAYVPGPGKVGPVSLAWMRAGGRPADWPTPQRPFMNAALAPDARRAAVTVNEGGPSDVWVADGERGVLTRVTFEGHNVEPLWAPDGRHVTYAKGGGGPFNVFWAAADGSAPPRRLLRSGFNQYPNSWSPDGTLVYTELHPETGSDLWVLPPGGSPRPLLRTRFDEGLGIVSPDGRWLAYESNQANEWQVYVGPYPALVPRWQVSTEGGYAPFWSGDGRRLYYTSPPHRLIEVPVATASGLQPGRPRVVLEDDEAAWHGVSDDGRFLALRGGGAPPATRIHVVTGWFEELARAAAR